MNPFKRRGQADFAAILTPTGHHVISYRHRRRTLEVERYRRVSTDRQSVEGAAEQLAATLEAEGGRGGRVAVAIAGFGSCHHLLSLPDAGPAVLEPVLQREMRRFFPDLYEADAPPPSVASTYAAPEPDDPDSAMRDLLIGGVPDPAVRTLRSSLRTRSITLEHLTVLPAAILRVYQAYLEEYETAALAIALPRHSVAGFFHQGGLRLFTEPPTNMREGPENPVGIVADQVSRGALYLRQQFRGSQISSVFLSADRDHSRAIMDRLAEVTPAEVKLLDPNEPAGALLALGVALDRYDPDGLNLLPVRYRPPSAAQQQTRRMLIAASLVLALASGIWALLGIRREARAAQDLDQVTALLEPQQELYNRIAPVVDERQAHTVRSEILRQLVAERERLPQLLWPLREAGSNIEITNFRMRRTEEGWSGSLAGTATSFSATDAAARVDNLYRNLAGELPGGAIQLDDLSYGEVAEDEQLLSGVAVSFRLSFIVPLEDWIPQ